MNNNFEKMFSEKLEGMMEQYMEAMMVKMFSSMFNEPQVAKAEITTEAPKTLSREEFLALCEEPIAEVSSEPIELRVNNTKTGLVFNRPVSKDIWTINYLNLKHKYPNVKYDKNTKGFRWNKVDSNEFRVACRDYQVITEITEEHKKVLDKYYKDKAKRQAEYYANKAK